MTKGQKKIGKVMHEYKEGTLRSGSGKKVANRKQAVAIALSEARKAGARVGTNGGNTDYSFTPNTSDTAHPFPGGEMIPGSDTSRCVEQEVPVSGANQKNMSMPPMNVHDVEVPTTGSYQKQGAAPHPRRHV